MCVCDTHTHTVCTHTHTLCAHTHTHIKNLYFSTIPQTRLFNQLKVLSLHSDRKLPPFFGMSRSKSWYFSMNFPRIFLWFSKASTFPTFLDYTSNTNRFTKHFWKVFHRWNRRTSTIFAMNYGALPSDASTFRWVFKNYWSPSPASLFCARVATNFNHNPLQLDRLTVSKWLFDPRWCSTECRISLEEIGKVGN